MNIKNTSFFDEYLFAGGESCPSGSFGGSHAFVGIFLLPTSALEVRFFLKLVVEFVRS